MPDIESVNIRSGRQEPLPEARRIKLSDVMTREVVTVSPDLSVESLVDMMLERGISRVPVVDEAGRPIGMVAKTDVLVDSVAHGDHNDWEPAEIPRGRNVFYSPAGFHLYEVGALVGDVMCRGVVSLPESASLADAAELMATRNLHGIPVTSGGKVVGLISDADVVAWVAGF